MIAAEAPDLDISELAEHTGVTVRTIRFYIQQGLLPSPGQTGPGVKYGEDYVARLRVIRRLQRDHLPLAEVRKRLSGLDAAGLQAALDSPLATNATAVDYVRSVLGETPKAPLPFPRKAASERSTWERVALSEDVELHVRRPLSREANRRVERLLEQARRVFEEQA
ncbi:MAG TPA: MerR family transcriptional regulator [Vicinamibacteria bacterium]